jgi:FKBP-type peptidyl-prolyl cis-trans isomerase
VAFKLGADGVMPAWNPGVTGMRAGGKRRLMVPDHLGYGERGLEDVVPPGADLIVEIELLEIK